MDISPLHDTRVSEFMADIKYTFEDAFDDSPSIGVSIENPSGNSGVGTLGGYLRVSGRATASSIDVPDSKIKYMALTCHHVLTSMLPQQAFLARCKVLTCSRRRGAV